MRFIKCYVVNFGTLSETPFDFHDGLNVIKEDNGFGKSTLATFIKAMLYGLPQSAKKDIDENERKKFKPWQGTDFGGTLDFETKNKKYRIERFFGEKQSGDSFRLRDLDTGRDSCDFSQNIGAELLGIDADSFERCAFLMQGKTSSSMTVGINTKLTDLVENSDDMSNFDKAIDILSSRESFFVKRGSKGALFDIEKEIAALKIDISDSRTAAEDLDRIGAALKADKAREKGLLQQQKSLRERITAAAAVEAEAVNRRQRALIEEKINKLGLTVNAVNEKYRNGLPDENVISAVAEKINRLSAAKIEYEIISTGENGAFENVKEFFSAGVPELQVLKSFRESVRIAAGELAKATALKEQLEVSAENGNNTKQGGKRPSLLLAVGGAVIAAAGMILSFINTAASIALAVAGLVAAGAGAFIYLKNLISQRPHKTDNASELKAQYELLSADSSRRISEAAEFASQYTDISDAEEALSLIDDRLREYQRLFAAKSESDKKKTQSYEKIEMLSSEIDRFFERFTGEKPENYTEELTQLHSAVLKMKQAVPEFEEYRRKLSELPEPAATVAEKADDSAQLQADEKRVGDEIDSLRERMATYSSRSDSLMLKADRLPELETRLDECNTTFDEYNKSLAAVRKASELLKIARDNLSSKYVKNVEDNFKKYIDLLSGSDFGGISVDNDLNVLVERHGKVRETAYFSAGYKNIIDICMHMALCDALFGKEPIPVILDDPFVNLDDSRVENALAMLKKLSAGRQIVYLTCHSSRSLI